MKRTKRLLLAVLVMTLVLTSTLLIVAACGEQGFAVTAEFDSQQGNVTISKPLEGTLFDQGEEVTVTVTPNEGYEIASFAVSGQTDAKPDENGQYKFNVNADTKITVVFRGLFGIAVNVTPEGKAGFDLSTPANGSKYHDGETATLTVTVDPDYTIVNVKVNGAAVEGENDVYTFTVTEPTTVDITLKQTRFNVTAGNCTNGSVSLSKPANGTKYAENEQVTVTPAPAQDYAVDKVYVGETELTPDGDEAYKFTVTADVTVTATFKKVAFQITTKVTPDSSAATVTYSPAKDRYQEGDEVTVTVEADSTHLFKEDIKVNGEPLQKDDNGEYKFTVHGDATVEVGVINAGIVNVYADRDGGVKVTRNPDKTKYDVDESVNITIEANEGYTIKSVTHNGDAVQPVDGVYTFDITFTEENYHEFNVELESPADKIVANMKGGLHISGGLPDDAVAVDNYYDATNNRLYLQVTEYGLADMALLAEKQDDSMYMVGHDLLTGKKETYEISGDWSALWNPFESMTYDFLIDNGDDTWSFSVSWANYLLQTLTGFTDEDVSSNSVTISGEKITEFQMVGKGGTYTFTVSEFGTATVPEDLLSDYQEPAELKSALEAAAEANAYTITVYDDYDEEGNPVGYKVIVTDKAFYDESLGGGLYERADGSIWTYSYSEKDGFVKGTQVFNAPQDGFKALFAAFAMTNEKGSFYHLFHDVGEGVYELRYMDLFGATEQGYGFNGLPSVLASYFTTLGADYTKYFDTDYYYLGYIGIAVEAGKLSAIDLLSVDYSTNNFCPAYLEFDFENVELPFEIAQEDINGRFTEEFVGYWTNDDSTLRAEINIDNIIINGVEASSIKANDDGSYSVRCVLDEYTIQIDGNDIKITDSDDNEYTLHKSYFWEDFVGTYQGKDIDPTNGDTTLDLVITKDGDVTLTFTTSDGSTPNKLSISDLDYVDQDGVRFYTMFWSYINYNNSKYEVYLIITLLENNHILEIDQYVPGLGYMLLVNVYSNDYEGIKDNDFSTYYGNYTDQNNSQNKMVISESGIDLTLGGKQTHIAAKDITYYDNANYSIRLFIFEMNGASCQIQQYGEGYGKLLLIVANSGYLFINDDFDAAEDHPSWEVFVGTYYGWDVEKNRYVVEITKETVTFTVNGEVKNFELVDFDLSTFTLTGGESIELYMFEFTSDGERYALLQVDSDIYYALFLESIDDEGYLNSIATLVLDQAEQLTNWSEYNGTYVGDGYTIVISDDGITITPPDGQGEAKTYTTDDFEFWGDFNLETESYYFTFEFYKEQDEERILTQLIQPQDNGLIVLAITNEDGTVKEQHILVDSDYSLPDYLGYDWLLDDDSDVGYWTGTGTSEEQTAYAFKVIYDEDTDTYKILLKVGDAEFVDITKDLVHFADYSEIESQEELDIMLVWLFKVNGTAVQVAYSFSLHYSQMYMGESCVIIYGDDRANLSRSTEPVVEPTCTWTEYIGTWQAQDEYLYTVVISADGLHITYNDVDYIVAAADITFDPETGFRWTHDDVVYEIGIDDGSLEFRDQDYEYFGVYLEKVEA